MVTLTHPMGQWLGLGRSILSAVLIFVFVMAGANKVTDAVHAETHQELAKGFVQYGPVSGVEFLAHIPKS
jgi:hypothetical protein